jgi:UDP-glucose 4-epimerase
MNPTLVTGSSTPLGAALVARLRRHRDLTIIETGSDVGSYENIADLIMAQRVATVIHAGLVGWSPIVDVDVIATMRLAAAASQPGSTVRTVAAASSVLIYPATSAAPRQHREHEEIEPAQGGVAARLLEAEQYMRALADDNPHISVAILRLADLAGAPPQGPLAKLLSGRPIVPAIAGFDPPVQLLDLNDAAIALERAADLGLAGTYNVAADGALPWSAAVRLAGGRVAPVPGPPSWIAALAPRLGLRALGPDLVHTLRFGRLVDTGPFGATGFQPKHTTADCAARAGSAGRAVGSLTCLTTRAGAGRGASFGRHP